MTDSLQELMDKATSYHRSGRLADAEAVYREVLGIVPSHSHALHLLGLVMFQTGRSEQALELIERAIKIQPGAADFHLNRGVILERVGRCPEAIEEFRKAEALKPLLPEIHINLGSALRKVGRYDEAIASCRRALELRPDAVEALLNLGNAQQVKGALSEAVESFGKVVQLRPNMAEGHFNLANALKYSGRRDEAVAAYNNAIRFKPDFAQAHAALGTLLLESAAGGLPDGGETSLFGAPEVTAARAAGISALRRAVELNPRFVVALVNLGQALQKQGEITESVGFLRQAVAVDPSFAPAQCALGSGLLQAGDLPAARNAFGQAIAQKPENAEGRASAAEAHTGLGHVLAKANDWPAAAEAYRRAIVIKPDHADAFAGLANALSNQGLMDESIAAFRQTIKLRPSLPQSYSGLGTALATVGEMDEAIASLRQGAALAPDDSAIQNNLGVALKRLGMLDEALACYRRAVSLRPDNSQSDSNRVYALYFHPDYDARAILREHLVWNLRHAEPLKSQIKPLTNDRDKHRRLRVGFISPDFRAHVVGRGLLPFLQEYDKEKLEIYCYSNNCVTDSTTDRFLSLADRWRDILTLSDDAAADLIRADKIDILVDLTLHMANHRLLVMARKPAPVQLTYLGYCGTTGLSAIDYRLSDPHLDPPDSDVFCYSEQTVRLPVSYWCYAPGGEAPDPGPGPAAAGGGITFGCLNNFSKISGPAIDLWARILNAVPRSRLILHCPAGMHREIVHERFATGGVDASRIEMIPAQDWAPYMQSYERIDISLDPFPYGGGITTCDSLWMGVPVVSLSGGTAVGRGGRTILNNVGLGDLVAESPEDYVRLATSLAADPVRLGDLRSNLRKRMQASPLMDAKRFARDMEAALREVWGRYCDDGVSEIETPKMAEIQG